VFGAVDFDLQLNGVGVGFRRRCGRGYRKQQRRDRKDDSETWNASHRADRNTGASRPPRLHANWLLSQLECRAMRGERAERFVVLNLRLLAASFAVDGILFIAAPDGVLSVISDLGDDIGSFTRAPETTEQLWLSLGFAYMVVIAALCIVAQADVVRYRPLIMVLAIGKTASSLSSLGFFLFDENVFAYLLNFLVDGFLALLALWLWSLAGRVGRSPAPG
jgi:hypothetical protein